MSRLVINFFFLGSPRCLPENVFYYAAKESQRYTEAGWGQTQRHFPKPMLVVQSR